MLASSRSSSASAWVSWVNAPSGSALPLLCAFDTALHGRIPRGAEFRCVRDVALRELPGGLVDACLDVGDRRGQTSDGAVDVGGGAVDGVEQGAGLTQRGLRGTNGIDQPALPIGGRATSVRPLVMFWSANDSRCLAVSTLPGHRGQRRVGELRVQPGHGLLRRFETRGQIHHLLGQRVEPGRGVDDADRAVARRPPAGSPVPVGPRRRDDHPGQQVAPLLRGLGHGVVEDLAHVERLGERLLGVVHRRGERCGVLLAEFLDRQRQFVVAGAYGVVDVDDDRCGTGRRARRGTPPPARWGRRDRPVVRRRTRPRGACACRRRLHNSSTSTAMAMIAEDDHHAHPVDPARGRRGGSLEAVGGGDRGACPVATAQGGLDLVAAQVSTSTPPVAEVGTSKRVGAVGGGDGEDGVLVLEVADPHACSGPTSRRPGRRRSRRRPPTAGPAGRCRGPVDGGLHVGAAAAAQRVRVVGDVVGQPERRVGPGRRRGRHQHQACGQDRENQAEQAGHPKSPAHDRQSNGRRAPGTRDRRTVLADCASVITSRRPIRRLRPPTPGGRGAQGCRAAGHRHRAPHRLRPGPRQGAAQCRAAPAGRQDAGGRSAAERDAADPADPLAGGGPDRAGDGDRVGLRSRPRRSRRAGPRHRPSALRAQRRAGAQRGGHRLRRVRGQRAELPHPHPARAQSA